MMEYNTIILGAGISGISCAIYLKRGGLNVLVIEEKEEEPKVVDNKPKKEDKQPLSQTATLAQAIEKIKQF